MLNRAFCNECTLTAIAPLLCVECYGGLLRSTLRSPSNFVPFGTESCVHLCGSDCERRVQPFSWQRCGKRAIGRQNSIQIDLRLVSLTS